MLPGIGLIGKGISMINQMSYIKNIGKALKKPKDKAVKTYEKVTKKLKESGAYEKVSDVLGQDAGDWFKEAVSAGVQNGGLFNAIGGIGRGIASAIEASRGPDIVVGQQQQVKTSDGKKVPGVQQSQDSMRVTATNFNKTTRGMNRMTEMMVKQSNKNKHILDTYKKSASMPHLSLPGVSTMGSEMRRSAEEKRGVLTKDLSSKSQIDLKPITSAKIETPPNLSDPNSKTLASYVYRQLSTSAEVSRENFKRLNDNLKTALFSLDKKQRETAQIMMTNLGKYNAEMYQKIVSLLSKAEMTSFQKSQQSAIAQTEILGDKLDSSHDYEKKSTDIIRSELIQSTQTMHALHDQSMLMDQEYRMNEERRNGGVTLSNLHGMLQNITNMMVSSFTTPQQIDKDINMVWMESVKDLGFATGYTIQSAKEILDVLRYALKSNYDKIEEWSSRNIKPIGIFGGPIHGALMGLLRFSGNAMNWATENIFEGLLGTPRSMAQDLWGDLTFVDRSKVDGYGYDSSIKKGDLPTYYGGVKLPGTSHAIDHQGGLEHVDVYGIKNDPDKGRLLTTVSGRAFNISHETRYNNESLPEFEQRMLDKYSEKDFDEFTKELEALGQANGFFRATPSEAAKLRYEAETKIRKSYVKIEDRSDGRWFVLYPSSPKKEEKYTGTPAQKDVIKVMEMSPLKRDRKTIRVYNELLVRLSDAFRIMSAKGIRYRVTSVMRLPSAKEYVSPHCLGAAVDVVPLTHRGSMSNFVWDTWDPPYKNAAASALGDGTSNNFCTAMTAEILAAIHERKPSNITFLNNKVTEEDYAIYDIWWEIIFKIFPSVGLSPGARKYKVLNGKVPFGPTNPCDLVHIQLAGEEFRKNLKEGQANDRYFYTDQKALDKEITIENKKWGNWFDKTTQTIYTALGGDDTTLGAIYQANYHNQEDLMKALREQSGYIDSGMSRGLGTDINSPMYDPAKYTWGEDGKIRKLTKEEQEFEKINRIDKAAIDQREAVRKILSGQEQASPEVIDAVTRIVNSNEELAIKNENWFILLAELIMNKDSNVIVNNNNTTLPESKIDDTPRTE